MLAVAHALACKAYVAAAVPDRDAHTSGSCPHVFEPHPTLARLGEGAGPPACWQPINAWWARNADVQPPGPGLVRHAYK
ncbi:hypothetical protein V8C86DRAFT_2778330 [Haematococcus lacustris]